MKRIVVAGLAALVVACGGSNSDGVDSARLRECVAHNVDNEGMDPQAAAELCADFDSY